MTNDDNGDRPTSLGSVTLKSADPFEKPVIDPKYVRFFSLPFLSLRLRHPPQPQPPNTCGGGVALPLLVLLRVDPLTLHCFASVLTLHTVTSPHDTTSPSSPVASDSHYVSRARSPSSPSSTTPRLTHYSTTRYTPPPTSSWRK